MSLANFEHLLKDMIGLDAESIGASAVERAVQERQIACGLEDSLAYWECVQASEPERQLLIEAVVVPETWFFRHREALAAIGHLVQRDWMAAHPEGVCRILSVPCSSGEEPYSIAMALQDVSVPAHRFRIVAVDVSQRVLAQGRRGVYGRNSFRGTDLTFRDRYFTPVADGYHLVDTVRQQVHFEQGNLLSHAFLADAEPYDVIFCRNLLIYFDRPTQERAISALTRLLSPEGFLFVGSSETGLFLNNDFVSARLPMAFAFRRAAATRGKPEADALPPIAHARATCPHDLRDVRIVLDCAHGATYRVAPEIFRRLGADVRVLNASPDGQNINRGVGAMHPEGLQKEVLRSRAQLGLAFDGDGDRLISVDEAGQIRDGDYALAICGRHLATRGLLKSGTVVTTVMANLALDRALTGAGIALAKVAVGDRYVLEEMLRIGANLGGEQSGHLLFLDHATTGDGIVSALQLIGVMRESGTSLGELAQCLVKFPQVLVNVRVKGKPPVSSIPELAERAQVLEAEMNGAGRILLRYSGTESLLRVMIEGEEQARIERMAEELAGIIRRAIGA